MRTQGSLYKYVYLSALCDEFALMRDKDKNAPTDRPGHFFCFGEKARFVIEAFIHNLDRQSYVRAARLLSLPYVPRRRNRPRQPVKMEPRSRRQKVVGFLAQRFFGKSEEDVSNAKMSSLAFGAEAGFRAS